MKKEPLEVLSKKGQKLDAFIFKNTANRVILLAPGIVRYETLSFMPKIYSLYYSLGNSVC